MNFKLVIIVLSAIFHLSVAFYIKDNKNDENESVKSVKKTPERDEWRDFQEKIGLSNENLELLKSQKDPEATKELLRLYMKLNKNLPKTTKKPIQTKEETHGNSISKIYTELVKRLKLREDIISLKSLKSSLNFEFADKSHKSLKRPRRTISVKMVSDMPTDHFDEMLQRFYQQNGINNVNYYSDEDYDDDDDYVEPNVHSASIQEPVDYNYDNLYDDEEDLALSTKSRQNSQYGSFQDLILQAKQNEWELLKEERKLHSPSNEHFI